VALVTLLTTQGTRKKEVPATDVPASADADESVDARVAVNWRPRLSGCGSDKSAFYGQVGYNLAEQNPQAALQVLAELKGTDAYASTFGMMRGLVQIGGQGQQAAELIAIPSGCQGSIRCRKGE